MTEHTKANDEKKIRALYKKTPFLNWGKLRFIGSVRVLSVMSFVGACIAAGLSLPQLSQINIRNIISNPVIVWSFLGFFISLLLANLIHYIFCPAIIRKFTSLSDFYMHQINIKKCQIDTYPEDQFDGSLLHVSKQYIKDLAANTCARWASLFLFFASLIFFIFFVVNSYGLVAIEQNIYKKRKFEINFEFNNSELTNESKKELYIIGNNIKDSNALIIVRGFTDSTGSVYYNQKLSMERANRIKEYLHSQNKVSDSNIAVVGYGQLWPVAPNITEKDRKYNRRVEIEIIQNPIMKKE